MSDIKQVDRILGNNDAVLTIKAEAAVLMAAKKMRRHRVGSLVVTGRDGGPVGIITERDLVHKILASGADPGQTSVQSTMTEQVISVTSKVPIVKAQALMAANRIRHLPVIEDGLLLGMISSQDIVAHQLGAVRSILQRQMEIFEDLEESYPGLAE